MKQHTLQRPIATDGIGLHSGRRVHATLHPAPENHGYQFVRTDVPGSLPLKIGQAQVCDTTLCTGLEQHGLRVRTIEHLMASFAGTGLDNVLIEINAEEIPILDGSSSPWVHLIREAGVQEQREDKRLYRVLKPFRVEHMGSWLEVKPENSFKRRITIDFQHPLIHNTPSTVEIDGSPEQFQQYTARARTFGFMFQVEQMHAHGLAQGGSMDNAMVLDEHHLLNRDGLRMKDEFAQHKMLDLVGDLLVLGAPLLGHVEAYRPGHAMQAAFTLKAKQEKGLLEDVIWQGTDGLGNILVTPVH